jgi:hypothetical protein
MASAGVGEKQIVSVNWLSNNDSKLIVRIFYNDGTVDDVVYYHTYNHIIHSTIIVTPQYTFTL